METSEPRFNVSSFILGMFAMAMIIAAIVIWKENFSGKTGIGNTNCVEDMCLSYEVNEAEYCYKLFSSENAENIVFNQCFTNE